MPVNIATRAGELRHRVTVQKPVNAGQQANGEYKTIWTDVATVFASVSPNSGREIWQGDQVSADVTHLVSMRHGSHLAGYCAAWRLAFGTRILETESVVLRNEVANGTLDWQCRDAGKLTTDEAADEIV